MLSQTPVPFPPLISVIDSQPSEVAETRKLANLTPIFLAFELTGRTQQSTALPLAKSKSAEKPPPAVTPPQNTQL
jgi:hypothetical protein